MTTNTWEPISRYHCDHAASACDVGAGIRFEAGGRTWMYCNAGEKATGEKVGEYIRSNKPD